MFVVGESYGITKHVQPLAGTIVQAKLALRSSTIKDVTSNYNNQNITTVYERINSIR